MELIRGLRNLRQAHRGAVVTIGTYDGIHLGHQTLIRRVCERARNLGRPAMMLTFEPMPREFLAPAAPPARLTSLRERWRVLQGSGLDAIWLLRFDSRLRNMPGDEFAHLLGRELNAAAVVVGHDFRFGRNYQATTQELLSAGAQLGYDVEVLEPVVVEGVRVSSSGIREALAAGDFGKAARHLGRPYTMIGRVLRGDQLGRTLGFPTANLRIDRRRSPVQGILAVRVRVSGGPAMPGVASLGTRPTVGGTVPLLEAHVFDFDDDLYGREIAVEFVAKLRDERHFATLDALVEQMNLDAAEARRVLS